MVAITGVCGGGEKEDVQSLSTRDPDVEEISLICEGRGISESFNGIRHRAREPGQGTGAGNRWSLGYS